MNFLLGPGLSSGNVNLSKTMEPPVFFVPWIYWASDGMMKKVRRDVPRGTSWWKKIGDLATKQFFWGDEKGFERWHFSTKFGGTMELSRRFYLGFACLMLGTSSKNIFPHGGKKWWFTMVESLRNHQLNTSKLDYNPCRTGKYNPLYTLNKPVSLSLLKWGSFPSRHVQVLERVQKLPGDSKGLTRCEVVVEAPGISGRAQPFLWVNYNHS